MKNLYYFIEDIIDVFRRYNKDPLCCVHINDKFYKSDGTSCGHCDCDNPKVYSFTERSGQNFNITSENGVDLIEDGLDN